MTEAWLKAPEGAAAQIAREIRGAVPVLTTARLRLRAPLISDYPAYEAVFTSARSLHIGGPFSAEDSFADFCQGVAGWSLRGAGMWTVTGHEDEAPLGWIYLWIEQGDPEPELGWILTEAAEGRGFAAEAARAALPHALRLFGAGGFVSYIAQDNLRSARLAMALGAQRDAAAEEAHPDKDLHIYRHTGSGVSA